LAAIRDITFGQYIHRDSSIHRLDPRTKILAGMILMITIFVIHQFIVLLCFTALIAGVFYAARVSPLLALRNLRAFWVLFLFTLVLHGFFTEGEILLRIPLTRWTLSEQGVVQGFFYTYRIAVFIGISGLITLTTSPMALTDGVSRFLSPFVRFGLPAQAIAMMMSIALRFIPILVEEADRIRKAQISRGARFEGSPVRRLRQLIPVVIPLFLSAFRRANDLAMAMESRCYSGDESRTSYTVLRFGRNDFLAMITVVSGSGMVVLLNTWLQ